MKPDEATLPPLIEEILEPPAVEEKPPVQVVDATPTEPTQNDIEAMLDLGATAELVEAGFDAAELKALNDIDPVEEDVSEEEVHALLLEAFESPT